MLLNGRSLTGPDPRDVVGRLHCGGELLAGVGVLGRYGFSQLGFSSA
jgi:hypothetical protein